MKKFLTLSAILLITTAVVYSQSFYVYETFEGQDFPASGWTVSNYSKSPVENYTLNGHFSARSGGNMTYDLVYLISPKFYVEPSDKIYINFWYRRQTGVSNPFMVVKLLGTSSNQVLDSMYVDALMYWFPYYYVVSSITASDSVRVQIMTNTFQGSGRFFIDDVYISRTPALSPPPAAPSNLQITNTTMTSISLTWSDNAINEDRYFVQRRNLPDTNWNNIDTLPFNSNSYLDEGLTPNTSYGYRIFCWNPNGFSDYSNVVIGTTGTLTGTGNGSTNALDFSLKQNYPNPFNPITIIGFTVPNNSPVRLEVFDMTGKSVAVLYNGYKTAGSYNIEFDGSGLNSGIYFYRMQAENYTAVKKMTLIK